MVWGVYWGRENGGQQRRGGRRQREGARVPQRRSGSTNTAQLDSQRMSQRWNEQWWQQEQQ